LVLVPQANDPGPLNDRLKEPQHIDFEFTTLSQRFRIFA